VNKGAMVAIGIAVAVTIIGIYALTYMNTGTEKSAQSNNNSTNSSSTQGPNQNNNATGKRYNEVLQENVGVAEPKK
jgi:cell division protein FtsN